VQPQVVRDLRRLLESVVPGVATFPGTVVSVDYALPVDPPRTRACRVLEDGSLRVRPLPAGAVIAFEAFLDGTQESRALAYVRGVPIVLGQVAAVIRRRIERRLTTWGDGPRVVRRLFVPFSLLGTDVCRALASTPLGVVDTLDGDPPVNAHPHELLRRAVHKVQEHRESVERDLAEAWCAGEDVPLFVDGGLPSGERAVRSDCCVGVVKSHHTIYADGDAMALVLDMRAGHRSSVLMIERTWGPPVASWYLRLRSPVSHDPLWGMVRVEIALTAPLADPCALTARADLVSRWILAERTPLALPDGRWDRMVYGVRDCEEYLRARAF
jgi:hypothetical protein